MAGEHFQTLRAIFRPWYVKVGSGFATLFAAVGIYASLQDQFPDRLPKLQDMVTMAHILVLPWWGWLLVLQAVLGFGLYDYVRRTVPPASGLDALAKAFFVLDNRIASKIQAMETKLPAPALENRTGIFGVLSANGIADPSKGILESISQLREEMTAQIASLNTQIDERIKNAGFEKRGETVKFMADARSVIDGTQNSIIELRKATNFLTDKNKAISLDLLHIFDFEIDQATLRFLEALIVQVPVLKTPLANEPNAEIRNSTYDAASNSIQFVSAHLGDTYRGQNFRTTMSFAVTEAERLLTALAPSDWPSNISPVEFRRYAIVELQCVRAVAFLEHQTGEVIEKIKAARSSLIERRMEREAEIKEPSY